MDTVTYMDSSPWPGKADGKGDVLRRRDLFAYANDPANWSSKPPSPNQPLPYEQPEIFWTYQDNVLTLTFTGKLYESSDMKTWRLVEGASKTYAVEVASARSQYYCTAP